MAATHLLFEIFSEDNTFGVAYKDKILKRQIINYIDTAGNVTIADLSKELNISTPKIANLLAVLINTGLIKDYGKENSTGGRRSSLYGLVCDACYFIGVDVKHYYVNIGLLNFNKTLIHLKEKIPYNLQNSVKSYNELIQIINSFIEEVEKEKQKIVAVCINLSGRVNHITGYSYSFFNFNDEPLCKAVEKEIGICTFIENDSKAMAYGEFCSGGVVNKEKNVLFVNMDYGVGLGILIDGKIFYGKSGFSGEFGHIPFFNNEIICHCGKKGCLETEASGYALLRNFNNKIEKGFSSSLVKKGTINESIRVIDIVQAAKAEDILSIELIAEIGEKIGKGIAVLINILNPELVILGGILAQSEDFIRLPTITALNKFALNLVSNDSQLALSKLGEKAGVLGGCLVARNRVLMVS